MSDSADVKVTGAERLNYVVPIRMAQEGPNNPAEFRIVVLFDKVDAAHFLMGGSLKTNYNAEQQDEFWGDDKAEFSLAAGWAQHSGNHNLYIYLQARENGVTAERDVEVAVQMAAHAFEMIKHSTGTPGAPPPWQLLGGIAQFCHNERIAYRKSKLN